MLWLAVLLLATGGHSQTPGPGWADSLFAQSAAQILQREFSDPDISYLLLDARTGALLASRWENAQEPIPLGSLVKPFVAFRYGELHHFQYPTHVCRGTDSGCWLPRGHGRLNLTAAIANSCNAYFRSLIAGLRGADLAPSAEAFGFEPPRDPLTGTALMGIGNQWRISPPGMARAYIKLAGMRGEPGVREILAGLAESARQGTAAAVGRAVKSGSALAKTGTAACTHDRSTPGDGFVIALVPAEQPEILLMVRQHGAPGAKASAIAGRMLHSLGK
ncbi:MAG: hypothetical protein JST79_18655 [Acidobacteria bacterium]|jgi:cell division protein FtsI/penicillin-binding protein 2|nr:hypothetical protein [Acidobacteriota bacterium]